MDVSNHLETFSLTIHSISLYLLTVHLCQSLLRTEDEVLIRDEDPGAGHGGPEHGHHGEQVLHVEHVLVPHREDDGDRKHRAADEGNVLRNHRGKGAEFRVHDYLDSMYVFMPKKEQLVISLIVSELSENHALMMGVIEIYLTKMSM